MYVWLLLKLVLSLLVAITRIERVFSAMNVIKKILGNWMEDIFVNECSVTHARDSIKQIGSDAFVYLKCHHKQKTVFVVILFCLIVRLNYICKN